jgi:quercetin dioxygenase-like cupin family protein
MTKSLDQCLKDELIDRASVFLPGQGEVLEIKGGRITLKITSSVSNDQLGVYEILLEPGMVGAQLHFHRYTDETFIVTEGTLTVTHGETKVNAKTGSFANESEKSVTLMLIFNPAQSREGFFYGLQQIFNAPNFDAAAFTELNHKYDSYPVVARTSAAR